jgi:hypothetical protein
MRYWYIIIFYISMLLGGLQEVKDEIRKHLGSTNQSSAQAVRAAIVFQKYLQFCRVHGEFVKGQKPEPKKNDPQRRQEIEDSVGLILENYEQLCIYKAGK